MSEQQPVFNIEKIYIKDLSLEVPNSPQIFLEREPPAIELQMNTAGKSIADNTFEVVVTVTVTAKIGDKTGFLVEAGQAGIFRVENVPQQDLDPILAIACPNILFPYLREMVSEAVVRAGFPPLYLAPVNFEALYQQHREAEQQKIATPANSLQ